MPGCWGSSKKNCGGFSMLHWKNRLALILMSVAAVASVGGAALRDCGFHW
jgi:hypothetical protein